MIENQGYIVTKITRTTPAGSQERGIAIAQAKDPRRPAQWVTWRYVMDNGPYFYSGNYFDVERMAYHDFYRRLMEEYED